MPQNWLKTSRRFPSLRKMVKAYHFTLLFCASFLSISANQKKSTFRIIRDIDYFGDQNKRQSLDLIIPQSPDNDSSRKLPLVIWIHGGGWTNGSKESGYKPGRIPELIHTGRYIGATINYRLSGESKWPAQIVDCMTAINWLRENASQFCINPKKIAVWGSSAGGHLASMLGVYPENQNFNRSMKISSEVQAVINYYGPSAFLQMDNYPSKIVHHSPNSPESRLLGVPIRQNQKLAKQASPLHHVTNSLPPFLHFHGTEDPLVPYNQSLILHRKLLLKGNLSTLISVQNGGHSMPKSFTSRWVIPFLDYHFYGMGDPPVNGIIKVSLP
jgi:acetyl esterase/lipase